MRRDEGAGPRVFRPEKGMLAIWSLGALLYAILVVVALANAAPSDPRWWLIALGLGTVATVFARCLLIQVRVHEYVVEVRRLFGSRVFSWDEVERVGFSKWWAHAEIVTIDGRHHSLTGFRLSTAERFLDLRSHSRDVVDVLNEKVREAALAGHDDS